MRRRTILMGSGIALLGGGGALASIASMGSATSYASATAAMRAPLADATTLELIRYGTLAASGHNTQPWRFRETPQGIEVLADLSRRTPVVDPDDHHLFVSLGCATENILLAGAAMGRHGHVEPTPEPGRIQLVLEPGPATPSELVEAIPRRQATRSDYDGRALTTAELDALRAAAQQEGVDVVLLTERSALDGLRDLVVAGNTAQMGDPAFVAELLEWIRFNPREALERGDGLYSAASGNLTVPTWLGRRIFDQVFRVDAENDRYAGHVRTSAGVAVFFARTADPAHWIEVGRASQRFALRATALGLQHAFLNQGVEVAALRPELASLAGLPGRRPDLVMRFGRGPTLPMSPRRPVRDLLA